MGGIIVIIGVIMAALVLTPKTVSGLTATIKGQVDSIDSIIRDNSSRYGVPAALIKAIIRNESNFDPDAVNPSDPSYGLMQITPILAEDFGLVKEWRNVTDAEIAMIKIPSKNIQIGTWFLGKLLKKYPQGVAIQMYNIGEAGYNSGHRAANYLEKVTGYYNVYKSD